MSAVELGAYRYLTKPLEPQEILEVVGKAVMVGRFARLKREAIEASGRGSGVGPGGPRGRLRPRDGLAVDGLPAIVRVADRSLYAFEALLRSQEPSLPHPGAVIDAAERLNRLDQLGRHIRERAAQPMAAHADGHLVNLHPRDLLDESLYAADAPLSEDRGSGRAGDHRTRLAVPGEDLPARLSAAAARARVPAGRR